MAFSSTSKFVQLTPYLLMEYRYADQPIPESYFTTTGPVTVGYDKLVNGYMKNAVQIFNPMSDYYITQNGTENSVVKIAENSFVTLDSNLIIPFNDYSDELTNTVNLPITFPFNLSVVYDTVRYHIRAGYNLNNIDGLILGIEFQDQDLSYVTVSQILLRKGTEQQYTLNPNPVTIGSNIYDKYFEIKIPSLKDMNDKFISVPTSFQPSTLAGKISASGTGFVYNAPMRISVWQVQSTVDFVGYSRYDSARVALLSLEQEDPFSNIGALIQESDQGEFFEYFATDNEGFIEDFILFQNSIGNSYYIDHQIEVLEQIGASIIETSRFDSIQTTAYDTPNYYRPIVKNAAYSSTFFLRYTMSLVNSKDQSRVIRVSTYSSNNPSRWGTKITPIELSKFPQVQKIYNRIYEQPQIKLGGSTTPAPKEILKFTNVFIDQYYVTTVFKNLVMSGGSLTDASGDKSSVAYGNGKLTITVSPFDNYYKFTFLKSGPSGDPVAIDLTGSSFYSMAFVDSQGNKTYISALADTSIANPAVGEIAFRVDESVSVKILQLTDKRFFIVSGTSSAGNSTGTSTLVNTTGSAMSSTATATSSTPASSTTQSVIDSIVDRNNTPVNLNAEILGMLPIVSLATNSSLETNNPKSIMYWGYWKKQGDPDVITTTDSGTPTGATGATGGVVIVTPVGSGTQVLGQIEKPIIENPKPPIIQQIQPAEDNDARFVSARKALEERRNRLLLLRSQQTLSAIQPSSISGQGENAAIRMRIEEETKITQVASEILAYYTSGWEVDAIVRYYLVQGNPGYQKYKLTKRQFLEASKGILPAESLSEIPLLK